VAVTPCNSNTNAFKPGSNFLTHFIVSPEMQDCLPSISWEQFEAAAIDAKFTKNNPATNNSDLFIAHSPYLYQ
jgi:hypothetical protein